MDDWGQRAPSPVPRAFNVSDDGVDLTFSFCGSWRRVMIVLAWLLLFGLLVATPFVGAWLLQRGVDLWQVETLP